MARPSAGSSRLPFADTLTAPSLRPAARVLRLGFVPLVDAAPLLVAEALGLFDAVGLRVALSPEGAWAALRDKLAFGALDGAQMLGPATIALAAGLGGVGADVTVGCGLSQNGNSLVLSNRTMDQGLRPGARLAIVHPYSAHHYLLRRWLTRHGLDPERDVALSVVPPPRMAQRLAAGEIDGFCAGAPWGAVAEHAGHGRVVAGTAEIWPDHPEKLLLFRGPWVAAHREAATAATAAVMAAARWLDMPANREAALDILMDRAFWHLPRAAVAAAWDATHRIGFRAATWPDRAQAARWAAEMRAAGHLPETIPDDVALAPWSTSLWEAAARRLDEPKPPQTETEA